jgi:hypothetical protein
MRVGYAMVAAAADVPGYPSSSTLDTSRPRWVARYVREADRWGKSGLKGAGFRKTAADTNKKGGISAALSRTISVWLYLTNIGMADCATGAIFQMMPAITRPISV